MTTEETKKCPMCAEVIMAAAVKCKHCGERLDGAGTPAPVASSAPRAVAVASAEAPLPRWSIKAALAFWGVGWPAVAFMSVVLISAQYPGGRAWWGYLVIALGMGGALSLFTSLPAGIAFAALYPVAARRGSTMTWGFFAVFGLLYATAFYALWAGLLEVISDGMSYARGGKFWWIGLASCAISIAVAVRVAPRGPKPPAASPSHPS